MSNLKQTVTDFLNTYPRVAEELMYEGEYTKDWTKDTPVCVDTTEMPFECRGVDSYGGEGQGDVFWTVIEVRDPANPDETLLVKLNGWYSSYNGAEYTDWSFVTPKQKTITVYD